MRRSVIRKLIFVLAACLILVGGITIRRNVVQADPIREKIYTAVQIHNGDSLWSIAKQYCPSDSNARIAAYVKELAQLNDLGNKDLLRSGNYLTVYYYK